MAFFFIGQPPNLYCSRRARTLQIHMGFDAGHMQPYGTGGVL